MGGKSRRINSGGGRNPVMRKFKTRKRKKDVDEIQDDSLKNYDKLIHQKYDEDKPGGGQYYCINCARYFDKPENMKHHFRSKGHKKRLKELGTEAYSIAESERAAGMGSYIPPKEVEVKIHPDDIPPVIKKKRMDCGE